MIYISFNKSDLNNILKKINHGDTLICDVQNLNIEGVNIVNPYIDRQSENELINNLKQIFDKLDHPHITGYLNVFYEASILPISNYIYTLNNVLLTLKNNELSTEVKFPSKIIFKSEKSVFFLSEHETQFQFLYQRQLILQPYLEVLCKKNNINFSYLKLFKLSNLIITLPLRKFVVYIYRFYKSIYKTIKYSRINTPFDTTDIDFIAVTRLARKSEYIQPLLTKLYKNPVLFIEENFTNINSNSEFCKYYFKDFTFPFYTLYKHSIKYVIFSYFKYLTDTKFNKKVVLNYKGIDINLHNALNEVLINKIDLVLYITSFNNTLNHIKKPKIKALITTELKSPYAYADSYIANTNGFKCIHVMDCDQSDHLIPVPVFGDYLITNTRSSMKQFKQNWHNCKDKILFYGNLSSYNMQDNIIKKNNNNIVCYFTTARKEYDKIAIRQLYRLHNQNDIKLILKLHPRDNPSFYRKYRSLKIFSDNVISRSEIFNNFSLAMTYSSAIIHDLMIYNKPFIILTSNLESNFNVNIHENTYNKLKLHVDNIPTLKNIIKEKEKIFIEYQYKYLHDITVPYGLQKFKEKLSSFT